MQLIQNIELGSAATSINFSSIPQTFTDLYILVSARGVQAATVEGMNLTVNGAETNLTVRGFVGDGSAVNGILGTDGYLGNTPGANATSNTFGNIGIYVPNYSSSSSKSFSIDSVTENNATTSNQFILAVLYNSSTPITSLGITKRTNNLAAGSSATLFGIKSGSDGTTTVS